jgi:hypothetical protein
MKNRTLFITLAISLVSIMFTANAVAACKSFPAGKGNVTVQVNGGSVVTMPVDGANGSNDYFLLPNKVTGQLHLVGKKLLKRKVKKGPYKRLVEYQLFPKQGQDWAIKINGCKYREMTVLAYPGGRGSIHERYARANLNAIGLPAVASPAIAQKQAPAKKPAASSPVPGFLKDLKDTLQQAGF